MLNKSNEDAFNFLLDEFFIYHDLDDIEKHSIKQDNELESMMLNCYEILNEINKIQSNLNITKKVNEIKNLSSIKRYSNNQIKLIKNPNKIDKKYNNHNLNRSNNVNNIILKRNSFGFFKPLLDKKLDINSLFSIGSSKNETFQKNKSSILNHNSKKKAINLKKQYSQKNNKNIRFIIKDKYSLCNKKIKAVKKLSERNKIKKVNIKHFTISLLD